MTAVTVLQQKGNRVMLDELKTALERVFGLGFIAGFIAGMALPVTMMWGLRGFIIIVGILIVLTTYRGIIPGTVRALMNVPHKVSQVGKSKKLS